MVQEKSFTSYEWEQEKMDLNSKVQIFAILLPHPVHLNIKYGAKIGYFYGPNLATLF